MDIKYWAYALILLPVLTACGGSGGGTAEPQQTNNAPSIAGKGSVSISENTTVVLDVSATDPDGDTLSFTLAGDDADLFNITEDGQLNFDTADRKSVV